MQISSKIGLLVYPGDVGTGETVKIGALVIPHYLAQSLISQFQTREIEQTNIFSREVSAATVKEAVEKFQKELWELGIFTQLTLLPTTDDVDRVLTEGGSNE